MNELGELHARGGELDALGAAVTVYLPDGWDAGEVGRWVLALPAVSEVLDREAAADKLELPADRIGDLFVLANRNAVIGRTPDHHDLSKLDGSLRSHGGRYEEMVPLLVSEPLNAEYLVKASCDPRNFDVFDFACNGVQNR